MKFLNDDPVERLLYVSLAVLMLIIVLSAIGVAVRLHDQDTILSQIKTQATIVEKHTDCVGLLLTQPNRVALRIQDLNNCKIGP